MTTNIFVRPNSFELLIKINDSTKREFCEKLFDKWCKDNCGGVWHMSKPDTIHSHETSHTRKLLFIDFELDTDLMAFRLVWEATK